MTGQYAATVLIAAVLLAFIIYQQLRTRPINPRQLALPPLILAFLGLINLQHHPPDSAATAVTLGASVGTAIVFGVARGVTTRTWLAASVPMRKGTNVTLVLWIVGIALRLVIGGVARREGVAVSLTVGELPVFLGITLAAQNVVIWLRGQEIMREREGVSPAAHS